MRMGKSRLCWTRVVLHAQVYQSLTIIICLIMVAEPPDNFRVSMMTVCTYSSIIGLEIRTLSSLSTHSVIFCTFGNKPQFKNRLQGQLRAQMEDKR